MGYGVDEKLPAIGVDHQTLAGKESIGKRPESFFHRLSLRRAPPDHEGGSSQLAFPRSPIQVLKPSPLLRRAGVFFKPKGKSLIEGSSERSGLHIVEANRTVALPIPKPL